MSQTRKMSLVESVTKTVLGYFTGVLLQLAVFPLFGYAVNVWKAIGITAIFAVHSVALNYIIRRWFEART